MSIRITYLLGFIIVLGLLLTSAYLKFFAGFVPCPLCTLQQLTFCVIGLLFLIGIFFYHKRLARFTINILAFLMAIQGMALAGRQIWLQHFANGDTSECGVSLQYMMQAFPLSEVIQKIIFEGSAECTKRGWELFHLNMAEWSFLWFTVLLLLAVYLLLREFKQRL